MNLLRKSPPLAAVLLAFLASLAAFAGSASASPGAYRILVVQADCEPVTDLEAQLRAFPDVAAVDEFEGCTGTPTSAQLLTYDMVVSISNSTYADQVAYGNALADYVDAGGVVVQFAYDNWSDGPGEENGPTGRFQSEAYEPFIPGHNPNSMVSLGSFDAGSPLMQGVSALTTQYNTEPELAPGATLVASWSDGRKAIAYKGQVVSISAWIGDEEEAAHWTGPYARIALNAVRWLGSQALTVTSTNPAGGTVTSSPAGISCGATCTAAFRKLTPVALAAAPNKGFAFAGFTGACTGVACTVSMDGPKTVSANFETFALSKKLKRNMRKGTAVLTVSLGGPGKVKLSGRGVKARSKSLAAAGKAKLPVLAKGKAGRKLAKTGKAKLKLKVTFTPAGGVAATQSKSVTLVKPLP